MKNLLPYASLLLLSACGTIVHGPTQSISFESNVDKVKISGPSFSCLTPCSASVKRVNQPLHITAEKEGYLPVSGTINSNFSLYFLLGTTFAHIYATTTDYVTGSMYQYDQDKYFFEMSPDMSAKNGAPAKIRRYILKNYTHLQKEFSQKNTGEYVLGLSELTRIGADDLKGLSTGQSATEYANAVIKYSLSGSVSNARNPSNDNTESTETEKVQYPSWVELYEKEGYIGQTDRNNIMYIGYGEGPSLKSAKDAAIQDAYNKASAPITGRPDGSIKVSIRGMQLFSEFKHQSGQKFKMWLLYRYPKAQLEEDIKEYKKSVR